MFNKIIYSLKKIQNSIIEAELSKLLLLQLGHDLSTKCNLEIDID